MSRALENGDRVVWIIRSSLRANYKKRFFTGTSLISGVVPSSNERAARQVSRRADLRRIKSKIFRVERLRPARLNDLVYL